MKAFLKIRFWGLISAASFLACVATVLGFLGQWAWFCELFSHFRVQYLVGLLVLSLLLLVGKHKKVAVLCFVVAMINLFCVLQLFLFRPNVSTWEYPFKNHRAMLINVHSEMGDPELVMDVIREQKPELLVLEEVTESWMQALSGLTNSLPYCVSSPREDNFGIALFSKYPLIGKNILFLGEAGVPSILASLKMDGSIVDMLATHPLPPAGAAYTAFRNEQLDRVAECVKDRSPLLLLGDLNMTPWSPSFHRFIEQSGLQDSAKGYGIQPSWPAHFLLLGIPIDHCLHSRDIHITRRRTGSRVGSDHLPLIVDFTVRSSAQ
jgi:endonuclease/exonuclease/phosphatase (EEP) superfamily protein YafD